LNIKPHLTTYHQRKFGVEMRLFSKKNDKNIAPIIETKDEEDDGGFIMNVGDNFVETIKGFDWQHFSALGGGDAYQGEYDFHLTSAIIKKLYRSEPWLGLAVNAIARQFFKSKFELVRAVDDEGNADVVKNHGILTFLHNAGKENRGFFYSNLILDLFLTGNAYFHIDMKENDKKRLPSEGVKPNVSKNEIVGYKLGTGNKEVTLAPEEVVQIAMPNPFSQHVGLSPLVALNLPVLIDKYGREYIVGFFLRGGNTSGIMETDAKNADQLMRFARSIMQAFGSRRNMHSDKILPKGAKFVGNASKFSEIQLVELLKSNQTLFRAATGATNTVLGIAENVNRATAFAELEHFWRMTIEPLQFIVSACIKQSDLWRYYGLTERDEIRFDNSDVEFLDNFDRLLDQDTKLKETWTVNERRERLGKDPMEGYDKLSSEIGTPQSSPLFFSMDETKSIAGQTEEDDGKSDRQKFFECCQKEHAQMLKPTDKTTEAFQREFKRWEMIVRDNPKDRQKAEKKIKKEAKEFIEEITKSYMPTLMKNYERKINQVLNSKSVRGKVKAEELEQDRRARLEQLKERAQRVIYDGVFDNGEKSFLGYLESEMTRAYKTIDEGFKEGENLDDIAKRIRDKFGDFYNGQAKTIVRTEFANAVSTGNQQFSKDLATVTTKMRKTWIAANDGDTRPEHAALHLVSVEGPADEVPNKYFQIGGEDYLRYPLDESGAAGDVINCRCELIHEVIEWKE